MNRIKQLREELKISQNELAKKLNKTQQMISLYENGTYEPDLDGYILMSKLFNCSIEYIAGKSDIKTKNQTTIKTLPVIGNISAGQPNWAEECIEGHLPIDTNLMKIDNLEDYFFLRVNGESMNKVVKNGAFALIHKQDTVNNGEIAVVLVNGYDATLKKFIKQDDLIILEPQSTDDSFQTQVYDKKTNIKILGKYVGKMELE